MKQIHSKAAFSLVEVALAVGIASFCLITIIALIPAGITANQTSIEQTEATGLMAGVVADLRSTPAPASAAAASVSSPRYGVTIPRANAATKPPTVNFFLTQDGAISGTINTNADATKNPHFRVVLDFYPPLLATSSTASSSPAATRVRVLITWPALSDANVSALPSKFSGSVETVVELNRNWLDH